MGQKNIHLFSIHSMGQKNICKNNTQNNIHLFSTHSMGQKNICKNNTQNNIHLFSTYSMRQKIFYFQNLINIHAQIGQLYQFKS